MPAVNVIRTEVAGDHCVSEDMSVCSGDPGVVQCGAERDETSAVLDIHTRRAGFVETQSQRSLVRVNDPRLRVTSRRSACGSESDGFGIGERVVLCSQIDRTRTVCRR